MKTNELTDSELRIAVAMTCGWKRRKSKNPDFKWGWRRGRTEYTYALPDYLGSYDAILVAVRSLIFSQRQRFYREIGKVFSPKVRIVPHHAMLMATPRQWCMAFLAATNPTAPAPPEKSK